MRGLSVALVLLLSLAASNAHAQCINYENYLRWIPEAGVNVLAVSSDVKLDGDYAYVAAWGVDGGLYVFDISNPAQPYSVGHFSTTHGMGVLFPDNMRSWLMPPQG